MSASLAPFRWNIRNPGLHRRLGFPEPARPPLPNLREDLLQTCGDVVRAAGDADLVFVGRSLESVFDLLCGLLEDTSWSERLQLLHLSLTHDTPGQLRRHHPVELASLWRYFEHLGLTPPQLLLRPRPVAFSDVVFAGRTYANLLKLLRAWCGEPRLWRRLRPRLRWVCLVERGHPRYDPWKPEDSDWTRKVPGDSVRIVSLDWRLWRYLAEDQPKTTPSFDLDAWSDPRAFMPPWSRSRLRAARQAMRLYRYGRWRRKQLAQRLEQPPRPEPWRGALIRELRVG